MIYSKQMRVSLFSGILCKKDCFELYLITNDSSTISDQK